MDDLEKETIDNNIIIEDAGNKIKPLQLILRKVALTGIFIALSFVISLITKFIPIFKMPQGGSISFEGIGLVLGGLYLGPIFGTLVGVGYGLLNFMFDGYFLHWGSLFFDYIFAFGFISFISGCLSRLYFKGKIWIFFIATVCGFILRWVSSSLSGVIFFAEYAGDKNVWLYSFILYNLPYCAGSMGAVLALGSLFYIPQRNLLKQVQSLLH